MFDVLPFEDFIVFHEMFCHILQIFIFLLLAISIDSITGCLTVKGMGGKLFNTVSAFGDALFQILRYFYTVALNNLFT